MMRNSCALTVLIVVWVSQAGYCAEPSPPSQPPFRFLSLAEARALALAHTKFPANAATAPAAPAGGQENGKQPSYLHDLIHPLDQPRSGGAGAVPYGWPLLHDIETAYLDLSSSWKTPSLLQRLLLRLPAGMQIEFERDRCKLLLDVEAAYWNLYSSWRTLHSTERALRLAREIYRQTDGKNHANVRDLAVVRGTYEQLRGTRLITMETLKEDTQRLCDLTGLPRDGRQLVPSDCAGAHPCRRGLGFRIDKGAVRESIHAPGRLGTLRRSAKIRCLGRAPC